MHRALHIQYNINQYKGYAAVLWRFIRNSSYLLTILYLAFPHSADKCGLLMRMHISAEIGINLSFSFVISRLIEQLPPRRRNKTFRQNQFGAKRFDVVALGISTFSTIIRRICYLTKFVM